MKTVETVFRGKKRSFQLPENWKEVDKRTFAIITEMLPALQKGIYAEEPLRKLCMAGKREWKKTGGDQKLLIAMQLGWVAKEKPEHSENLTGSIRHKGRTYDGFTRMFSNLTWGEFIWADTFFMLGKPEELAAVLWRERTRKTSGLDTRVPFDERGMQRRAGLFRKLPAQTIAKIFLNYAAVRKTALEDKYTSLFPKVSAVKDDLPDEYKKETTKEEEKKGGTFSWFDTHNDIMGDNFHMAEAYEKTRLSTVLYHLDKRIREEKTRKRKGK